MPQKNYKIHSLLICDDVRKEDNGKEILIGVYLNKIVSHKPLPIILPKLYFRIEFTPNFVGEIDMAVEIISPSRKKIVRGKGTMTVKDEGRTSVALPFASVNFPEKGIYSIRLGIGRPPRKIAEFEVDYEPK